MKDPAFPDPLPAEAKSLPLVPLRDMVVFPKMMAPFVVGRASSIAALEVALLGENRQIFLAAQRDPKVDEPAPVDIHEIGVVATVVQSLKLPNGHIKVMVEGVSRGRIRAFATGGSYLGVAVEPLAARAPSGPVGDVAPYMQKVLSVFEQYAKLSHHLAFEGLLSSLKLDDADIFADMLAGHLPAAIATSDKQTLLETVNPLERLQKLQDLLEIEIEKINIDRRINNKVKKQMERAQKEYYLNEKIKAIHQELGKKDEKSDEVEELRAKIEKAGMPKETKEKALQELKRLEAMPNVSAEATVSRNYIDWLVNVPWKKSSREMRDIKRAEKILNEDHFGLEKVKERILEFLAVRQLVTETRGSILCFVGPPGVGKTSLAKSIAKSLNRKFVRLSLGGVRDEAEIRGHRRTYIGAFPGQIIQLMKKAGTVNPVFLLDEVDKMSMDFRGDPSSALLEVLDPEQNHAFVDHYLDVEYDLSKVMFIATANVVHPIPPALKDRMEIIALSGYTPNEKLAIAKQFLIKKQVKENGLAEEQALFEDGALYGLIEKYTREAGVRSLEREIASICRKIARKIVGKDVENGVTVTAENLPGFLGKPRFRLNKKGEKAEIGLATGLAWTETGGDVLHIETTLMRGKGNLVLTGQLGEVMQESARAAMSYVRTRAELYGADADFYETKDIHVHIPEGAIPKDGPSAGITMATSILSAVTKIPVRKDIAMTGEITLRGKVLPVGGIKEKLLAAYRAGLTSIVLPKENDKDLDDLPEEIRSVMECHLVDDVDEVVRLTLEGSPSPVMPKPLVAQAGEAPPDPVAH
ncbi:MAG TPA: endopeptidase La [Thermoanaerobaculia bacterium]|nr:endopeptidase La [Thermoanaerobaculia bacterium]